uniref:Uncharacterized protein n=1 Tax=Varanus komodoensis TaxID=61221 RepID=A0A8D2LHS0_VARKO
MSERHRRFRHSAAAWATWGLSPRLAATDKISSVSLSISFAATSWSAATMFLATTAPRCWSSTLGLSSRACRITCHSVVWREGGRPDHLKDLHGEAPGSGSGPLLWRRQLGGSEHSRCRPGHSGDLATHPPPRAHAAPH